MPAGLPKALAEAEITSPCSTAWPATGPVDRRDRAMLEVLYGTGLRIAELVGLSLADVDLDGSLLRAFGKGRKERIVPLGRLARQSLETWLDPGGRPAHGAGVGLQAAGRRRRRCSSTSGAGGCPARGRGW